MQPQHEKDWLAKASNADIAEHLRSWAHARQNVSRQRVAEGKEPLDANLLREAASRLDPKELPERDVYRMTVTHGEVHVILWAIEIAETILKVPSIENLIRVKDLTLLIEHKLGKAKGRVKEKANLLHDEMVNKMLAEGITERQDLDRELTE